MPPNYLKYIAENQGINAEDDALHIIAQKADGAMRDALSIFDRVVSFSGKELTRKAVTENLNVLDYDTYFKATDLILEHNIPELLLLFNETLALGFDGHHFISGLASHFRDLMVCQHQATINLLEVGDNAKQHYLEQSKKTGNGFLLQALDLANDCDLKYKTSKNQRLLVELTLMKLASIGFGAEKKNLDGQDLGQATPIVPASHFKGARPSKAATEVAPPPRPGPQPLEPQASEEPRQRPEPASLKKEEGKPSPPPEKEVVVAEPEPQAIADKAQETLSEEGKKLKLDIANKRISALSLSSLKAKKAHENNKKDQTIDKNSLPRSPFTEEEMQKHWADFVDEIDAKGRKILASNLSSDVPKLLKETTIWIELPNSTMKKEIEREQYDLMEYLKSKLNNHFIELKITVNEATAKKFAFTPEEKYEKLREKNPAIDLLRKTFDLDL